MGPHGTVTFLFTDLEGSIARWEAHPEQMAEALAGVTQLCVARSARMAGRDGRSVYLGPDAVRALLAAQQELAAEDWGR